MSYMHAWPRRTWVGLLLLAAFCRVLLVAYSKEFREGYGAQMEQAFGDLCTEEAERGGATGLALL